MKRLLMVCALAGLAVACGDDDGDDPKPTPDSGVDSGVKPDGGTTTDAGMDGGGTAAAKVTNVGTACTVASQATACTGSAPVCQVETSVKPPAPVPGGSCSAVCSSDAECGPGGICPTGAVIAISPAMAEAKLGKIGYCNKSCVKGSNTCGAGFSCVSLNDLTVASGGTATPFPPLDQYLCFPTPTAPRDGGVSDGGTALRLDGGLDGGT